MPVPKTRKYSDGAYLVSDISNETLAAMLNSFATIRTAGREFPLPENALYGSILAELTYRIAEEERGRSEPSKPNTSPTPEEVLPGCPAELETPELPAGWVQLLYGTKTREGDLKWVPRRSQWVPDIPGSLVVRGDVVIRAVTDNPATIQNLGIPDGWEALPKNEQVKPFHKVKVLSRWEYVSPSYASQKRDPEDYFIREKIGGAA